MNEQLAVFHSANLPGHPANTLISHPDEEVDWPEIHGVRVMPMAGRFLVRGKSGALTECEDGVLLVDPDGHPEWMSIEAFDKAFGPG